MAQNINPLFSETYSFNLAFAINICVENTFGDFEFDNQKGVITFNVRLDSKIRTIKYKIDVTKEDYTIYVSCPIVVPIDDVARKSVMTEFICRVNEQINQGRFVLDCDTGAIGFRCFVDCGDSIPPSEVISRSLNAPLDMFKKYADSIVDVIFKKNADPKKIIEDNGKTLLDDLLGGFNGKYSDDITGALSSLNMAVNSDMTKLNRDRDKNRKNDDPEKDKNE